MVSLQQAVAGGEHVRSTVNPFDGNPQRQWGQLLCNGAREKVVGRPVDLVGPEVLFGRKEGCHVRYANDSSISSLHCCLYVAPCNSGGMQAWIEDLSVNGTFVNGLKIGKGRKLELQNLDEITLLKPSEPYGATPPYAFLLHLDSRLGSAPNAMPPVSGGYKESAAAISSSGASTVAPPLKKDAGARYRDDPAPPSVVESFYISPQSAAAPRHAPHHVPTRSEENDDEPDDDEKSDGRDDEADDRDDDDDRSYCSGASGQSASQVSSAHPSARGGKRGFAIAESAVDVESAVDARSAASNEQDDEYSEVASGAEGDSRVGDDPSLVSSVHPPASSKREPACSKQFGSSAASKPKAVAGQRVSSADSSISAYYMPKHSLPKPPSANRDAFESGNAVGDVAQPAPPSLGLGGSSTHLTSTELIAQALAVAGAPGGPSPSAQPSSLLTTRPAQPNAYLSGMGGVSRVPEDVSAEHADYLKRLASTE